MLRLGDYNMNKNRRLYCDIFNSIKRTSVIIMVVAIFLTSVPVYAKTPALKKAGAKFDLKYAQGSAIVKKPGYYYSYAQGAGYVKVKYDSIYTTDHVYAGMHHVLFHANAYIERLKNIEVH